MKILLVQDTDWLVRGPHQQHHLMERLSLRGHEIRVIDFEFLWKTQGRMGLYSKRQVFHGVSKIYDGGQVTVIRPGTIKIPWLDYVSLVITHRKEIDFQIRDWNPDVIIGFGILGTYLAMKLAKQNDIPFVYYLIDVLHTLVPFRLFQPLGGFLEKKSLRNADMVITINSKLRDYVVQNGAKPTKTSVLGAGIDTRFFNPSIDGREIRNRFGLNDGDALLLFMGWLYHFSGVKEVALELERTENHNLKLLIVGEGDAYDELQAIREEHGLQDRVILTGKKPYQEIPAFIAASDICLLPAYPAEQVMQDIVPIKMYEYMAMRKPVISTRLPGLLGEFGENNGVVYTDKPEDVVGKAIELVASGKLVELGSKARSFVEKRSWDNIATEFEGILESVMKEKRK